jgi:hypothetical protein
MAIFVFERIFLCIEAQMRCHQNQPFTTSLQFHHLHRPSARTGTERQGPNLHDKATFAVADEFCPRIIVTSLINHIYFFKSVYENESIKSVVIENMSKLEGIETEGFQKTGLQFVTVPGSVGVLGANCLDLCESLSSVAFELRWRLPRIEEKAFRATDLVEIILPASVEVLADGCFPWCGSLSSVACMFISLELNPI